MSDDQVNSKSAADLPGLSVDHTLSRFVSEINALERTVKLVMPLLMTVVKQNDKSLEEFISEESIESREEDGKRFFRVPINKVRPFERLYKVSQSNRIAFFQTPRALLVALVSRYDAYLGQLLRCLFYLRPELLNASQRSFSFQELVSRLKSHVNAPAEGPS